LTVLLNNLLLSSKLCQPGDTLRGRDYICQFSSKSERGCHFCVLNWPGITLIKVGLQDILVLQ